MSAKSKVKTQKQLEEYIEERAELFKTLKDKDYVEKTLKSFKHDGLPNPFDVVREFIKEKGLKLYGGQALHEHLAKKGKPIYNEYEFPDYDVFSPDAWNHAQELCDRLYKIGFFFVEAKASIVNDEKHQTFKVSVDLIYVLDLTQVGCPSKNLKSGDCDNCGLTLDKKCFSLFNNIPALDILTNDKKEYSETYDYKKSTGLYQDKMFVTSPDWLKISMFLEMTQPLQDPTRLEKVYKRLALFESEFSYDKCLKDLKDYNLKNSKSNNTIDNSVNNNSAVGKELLNYTEKFIKEKKLLHYGLFAYNFYIKGHKYNTYPINNYEVYTDSEPHHFYEDLMKKLINEFKSKRIRFKMAPRIMYWKDVDSDNYDIYFKEKDNGFKHLITFTKTYECMPYIESNKIRYAAFDRMKYIYYKGAVLSNIASMCEPFKRDYPCMLKNLIEIEQKLKSKEKTDILGGKYKQFVENCMGGDINKLLGNLYANFGKSLRLAKKTEMYIDTPKEGFITKVYPSEKDMILTSYRPAEKKTKYYKKLIKFLDQPIKNKSKGFVNNKNRINKINKINRIKSKRKKLRRSLKRLAEEKQSNNLKNSNSNSDEDNSSSSSNTNSLNKNYDEDNSSSNSNTNSLNKNYDEEFVIKIPNPLGLFSKKSVKSKNKNNRKNNLSRKKRISTTEELIQDRKKQRDKKIDIAVSDSISQF
jgi:hypothetical protein